MDNYLENLNITVIESSRDPYFVITDGQIEITSPKFKPCSLISIQKALSQAVNEYKQQIFNNNANHSTLD